ncbi:hypothetical protein HDU76_013266 [Blyttiomyces sp. JEL0837]|nr:hypothetical protein HDU76_013266 [Blyttiomyces sp. JEL0837]
MIIEHEGGDDKARESVKEVLKKLRSSGTPKSKRTFVLLWSSRAAKDIRETIYWLSKGINMITTQISSVVDVLSTIQEHSGIFSSPSSKTIKGPEQQSQSNYTCPFCGLNLKLEHLYSHVPLFHAQESEGATCCICKEQVYNFPLHLHYYHEVGSGSASGDLSSGRRNSSNPGPSSAGGGVASPVGGGHPTAKKPRQPVFALVIVRRPRDGKFLLVNEIGGQGWWLPGGGVDVGEDLAKAAQRETKEEAGVDIEIKGVLRVEYTPSAHGFRLRVIFYAEPINPDQEPKDIPDIESICASWVSLDQLTTSVPLRGREPVIWFPYVDKGGAVWPMSILSHEKDPCVFVQSPFRSSILLDDDNMNEPLDEEF